MRHLPRANAIKYATRIGANIREANYAKSKADFLSKLQISLKECYKYWLELFAKANIVEEQEVKKNCCTIAVSFSEYSLPI